MPESNRDSKTEKASPHRRMEARKKGNVFQSKDLTNGVGIVMTFLALRLLAAFIFGRFELVFEDFFMLGSEVTEFTPIVASRFMFDMAFNVFVLAIPVLAVAMVLGVVMSVSQTRFIFAAEQLKPKLERLNPIEGLKKMFSVKALAELVKAMLKITVIIYILYLVMNSKINELPMLITADLAADISWMLLCVFDVALFAGVGMVAIGILDFIYQWWEHERSLMMSKQEIKDEYKQLEGDPLIKSRIRSIRERRAKERMMAGVKEADVVIRNPEHYAVALKYDIEKNATPLVIAKGQDYVAARILKEAQKYNIMSVENPALARVLYAATEIGAEVGDNIPEEFMLALVEIIFKLYESKNKLGEIEKFAAKKKS